MFHRELNKNYALRGLRDTFEEFLKWINGSWYGHKEFLKWINGVSNRFEEFLIGINGVSNRFEEFLK